MVVVNVAGGRVGQVTYTRTSKLQPSHAQSVLCNLVLSAIISARYSAKSYLSLVYAAIKGAAV